jgi:cysteine-rich repeat protein
VGYFTPYHCATHVNPSITGWEGPGCHPLTVGFASACGCTTDADCVSGQETCVDGACAIGGTPVTCSCDTGLPNSCPAGRVCREGGCVLDCTAHGVADCAAYQVCTGGVCLNPYGIRFAEQIVWHMTHTPKPQHAVSTYALSDILVSLILDASLRIALDLRIFNRLRQFELLDLADYWVIDATLETWYQPGLEVRYQNDCDPVAGNWVTNWQPDPADPSEPRLVTRYNPLNATTGTLGNAGEEDDLLAWCGDTLPTDVADPEGATTNGIIEAVTDLVNWGEDIGMDIWSSNSLCVRQSRPGDPVSTPLAQWLADLKAQSATLTCQYTYQGVPYIFPCAELRNQLLWIWGCLDVNANPWGPLLASAFPGYVTQFSGRQVFNLDLMMDDYRNEFSLDHLDPAIRSYSIGLAFVGVFWYAEVAACFETRFAAMQPGELGLAGVTVEPCCGNGSLDQQGCGLGVSALPCELCDDGNRTAGDGCSPVCRLEDSTPAPRCGDGVRHVGLGEECDDGNQVSGDGCEPDCTLPPEPSPCPGAGLCGLVHDTPACADGACCNVVCGLNPACCLVEWSEACVQLAFELCAPCIGECTSNGYCDNPNCCVNPTDCVCYPPEHPVSVMICGPDCNGNGIADATEPDLDGNGIPDDCECVGGLAGDYDFDGDVDFMDYMVLGGCFAGPAGDLAMGCICADSNGDATVDLRDFATFQAAFGL